MKELLYKHCHEYRACSAEEGEPMTEIGQFRTTDERVRSVPGVRDCPA